METTENLPVQPVRVDSLPTINPLGIQSVYTDNVGTSTTPWDIRLIFTEIVIDGGQGRSELRANVVMTPSHAKSLLALLTRTVELHEKQYGAINIPESK